MLENLKTPMCEHANVCMHIHTCSNIVKHARQGSCKYFTPLVASHPSVLVFFFVTLTSYSHLNMMVQNLVLISSFIIMYFLGFPQLQRTSQLCERTFYTSRKWKDSTSRGHDIKLTLIGFLFS